MSRCRLLGLRHWPSTAMLTRPTQAAVLVSLLFGGGVAVAQSGAPESTPAGPSPSNPTVAPSPRAGDAAPVSDPPPPAPSAPTPVAAPTEAPVVTPMTPEALADQARATGQELEAEARSAVQAQVREVKQQAKRELASVTQTAIERTRVETDIFRFGIFPNTAGFMDARAHTRLTYLDTLSSGLYLDYTTARAVSEVETESRVERLVREYRAELDLLKGLLLLSDRGGFAWSVEPGLNAKLIYQDVQDSGFQTNSFDETVFRSSELAVTQWVSSAKLDSTLVIGERFTVDLSSEYLPLIYQRESGTSVTSQYDTPVAFSIANRTQGFQVSLQVAWDAQQAGRYALSARAYRNQGDVASRSSLVNGNFEYTFDTFERASREDYWVELTHTASYIPWFGTLAPAIALGVQQKLITTADDTLRADTYKLGFLLEWL